MNNGILIGLFIGVILGFSAGHFEGVAATLSKVLQSEQDTMEALKK